MFDAVGDPLATDRALAELRRLRMWYRVALIGFVPAIIVYGAMISLLPEALRRIASFAGIAIPVIGLWWINRLERRLMDAECPRCQGLFHGPEPVWLAARVTSRHVSPELSAMRAAPRWENGSAVMSNVPLKLTVARYGNVAAPRPLLWTAPAA